MATYFLFIYRKQIWRAKQKNIYMSKHERGIAEQFHYTDHFILRLKKGK